MYYPVRLVLKNYVPLRLEIGMLFTTTYLPDTEREFSVVWPIDEIPMMDVTTFTEISGFPIKLSLIDEDDNEIVEHHEIGWIEEDTELRAVMLKDLNKILQEYDGLAELDILEYDYLSQETITPRFVNQKVVVRFLQEEYYEEDEEETLNAES